MKSLPSKRFRILRHIAITGLTVLSALTSNAAPTVAELQADFRELGFGMFIHYNMETHHGVQWVEGYKDPATFNPGGTIDTDAWADAAKSAGMKYAVLTAKHVSGFCLWDSNLTTYDVMHPDCPYKQDLVAQFIQSFTSRGIKVGLYYCWRSPGFASNYKVLPPECDPASHTLAEQIEFQKTQIAELVTKYPQAFYIWNDGLDDTIMTAGEANAWIRSLRPDIIASGNWWDWNKKGTPFVDIAVTETFHFPETNTHPGETCWTLEQSWFWENGFTTIRTASEINQEIQTAHSRNANFILNVAPNKQGQILASSLAVLAAIPPVQPNLLVNGSFESHTVTQNGGEIHLITAGNPSPELPGWNVPHNTYWLYRNYEGVIAQDGSQWFGPQAGTSDLASQDFPVTAGNTYEVSWYSQSRPDTAGSTGTAAITLAAGAATGTTTMTTGADSSWTKYNYSFTPDTSTTATLTLSATSGIPYFDKVSVATNMIDVWYVNSTESWNGPRLVTGDWNIGQLTTGVLNHTGGTITDATPWALIIGQFATGAYYMSGNAGVITSGGTNTGVLVGNKDQGTWSMTDNSTATVGQLLFNSPAQDTLLLAGNATVNAGDLSFASIGNDYISITSGSAATLTVAGKVLSDYQAYVSAGNIRVDGVVQADFTKFVVTGNTLSLAPGGTYADWAIANGVAGTPAMDSDNDGMDNGVEYFMGITSGDPVFTANPALVSPANTITWPMSATFRGTYEVETSPDLGTWTAVTTKPAPVGGLLTYTLTPGSPGGKSFVRLVVVPD